MINTEIFKLLGNFKKKLKNKNNLHEPYLDTLDKRYVVESILKKQVSTYGYFTRLFEVELKKYLNTDNVIATSSGTAAMHAIIQSLKFEKGDEVFVQSLNFIASINCLLYCGLTPHFIDSSHRTLGADPIKLEEYIKKNFTLNDKILINKLTKKRVRAIIITHIYGYSADIYKLQSIARKYNLILIEDAAECIGSKFNNKHLGLFGDYGILSFNGNKTITTGGGGAILCKDKKKYKKLFHLVTLSKIKKNNYQEHTGLGFNYRMPSLNAALGISQLKKISKILSKKKKLYLFYKKEILKQKLETIKIYQPIKYSLPNFWFIVFLIDNKKIKISNFTRIMKKNNIIYSHTWRLLHKLQHLKKYPKMDLSCAKNLEKKIICMPSSPNNM
jgi:perosamine synthetase